VAVKRIAITGSPKSGKTTYANRLGARFGVEVVHTDDYIDMGWSEASAHAADVMGKPTTVITEGVAVPRALRKMLEADPGRKPVDEVVVIERRGSRGRAWRRFLPRSARSSRHSAWSSERSSSRRRTNDVCPDGEDERMKIEIRMTMGAARMLRGLAQRMCHGRFEGTEAREALMLVAALANGLSYSSWDEPPIFEDKTEVTMRAEWDDDAVNGIRRMCDDVKDGRLPADNRGVVRMLRTVASFVGELTDSVFGQPVN
jgi:hypothetical protein